MEWPRTSIAPPSAKITGRATTPVAVIERGTTHAQRIVKAELATLADEVLRVGIRPPSLTIVGDVVKLYPRLSWFQPEAHRNLSEQTWDSLYLGTRRIRFRMERAHAKSVARELGAALSPDEIHELGRLTHKLSSQRLTSQRPASQK